MPGVEPIRVGPDGRLTTASIDTSAGPVAVNDCSADRMRFANIDNFQFAQDLANDANRANATFYTVDPRGLAAFDMPIYRDMDEVGLAPMSSRINRACGAATTRWRTSPAPPTASPSRTATISTRAFGGSRTT